LLAVVPVQGSRGVIKPACFTHSTVETLDTTTTTTTTTMAEDMSNLGLDNDTTKPMAEDATSAWEGHPTLPCTGCGIELRKILKQQGQTGGWVAILAHLNKCCSASWPRKRLLPEGAPAPDRDLARRCIREAEAHVAEINEAKLAAKMTKSKSKTGPTTRSAAAKATVPDVHCDACGQTFNGRDRASYDRHVALCKDRQDKREKHYEDTDALVKQALRDAVRTRERAEDTLKAAKDERRRAQEAQQAYEKQKKRERATKNKAGKARARRDVAFVYHEMPEAEGQDGEIDQIGRLVKANRDFERAKKALEDAKKAEKARKLKVDHAEEARAACGTTPDPTPKSSKGPKKVEHVLPKSRRQPGAAKAAAPEPAGGKSKKRKASKEELAAEAKTKSKGKKGRRGAGGAREAQWHQENDSSFSSSRAGRSSMAVSVHDGYLEY